jgi:hypothetical protein
MCMSKYSGSAVRAGGSMLNQFERPFYPLLCRNLGGGQCEAAQHVVG